MDRRSYSTPGKIFKRQERNTDKKKKTAFLTNLQPDRNVIDDDLRKCVDESEFDDRAMKNDQRSIKVIVTENTHDKRQDDERVKPGRRELAEW